MTDKTWKYFKALHFLHSNLLDALDENVPAALIDVEAESDNVPDVAPDLHQNGTTAATRSVEVFVLRYVILHREHGLPVLEIIKYVREIMRTFSLILLIVLNSYKILS